MFSECLTQKKLLLVCSRITGPSNSSPEKNKNKPTKSYTFFFFFFLGWSTLTVLLYMKIYCDATFSCEFVTEMWPRITCRGP